MKKGIVLLSIESSCDDTAAALLKDGKILSNFIANQKVHEKYGGVVPELASRAHMQNIVPVVDTALKEAGNEVRIELAGDATVLMRTAVSNSVTPVGWPPFREAVAKVIELKIPIYV